MGSVIHLNGHDYYQAAEAAARLGGDVVPRMIWDWKRRRLITGYRVGRAVYFRYDQLVEVEFDTRTARGGRPRTANLTSANA